MIFNNFEHGKIQKKNGFEQLDLKFYLILHKKFLCTPKNLLGIPNPRAKMTDDIFQGGSRCQKKESKSKSIGKASSHHRKQSISITSYIRHSYKKIGNRMGEWHYMKFIPHKLNGLLNFPSIKQY